MRIYATVAVVGLLLVANSCADAPTKPQPDASFPDQAPLTQRAPGGPARAGALTNVPVTMPVRLPASSAVGTFVGRFSATHVEVVTDPVTGKRTAAVTGVLTGVANVAGRLIRIPEDLPSGMTELVVTGTLSREEGNAKASILRPTQASCDILFLDLGPIHLDLLGLVLDVSQIIIDLNAQTGAGNLLGNLLCGLLGLLDLPGLLAAISQLLDLINSILNAGGGAGMPVA